MEPQNPIVANEAPIDNPLVGNKKSIKEKFQKIVSGFKSLPKRKKNLISVFMTIAIVTAIPVTVATIVNNPTSFFNRAAPNPISGDPSTEYTQPSATVVPDLTQPPTPTLNATSTPSGYPSSYPCKTGVNSWSSGTSCKLPTGGTGLLSAKYQCYDSSTWYTATLDRCATAQELSVISTNFCSNRSNCQTPSTGTPTPKASYPPCVEQCPGTDNILRNCTPPESDGTSSESLCNSAGRIESCGGRQFCCPTVGAAWTTNLTACSTPVSTIYPSPTPVSSTPISTSVAQPTSTPTASKVTILTTTLPTGRVGRSYFADVIGYDINPMAILNMTLSNLPSGLSNRTCAQSVGGTAKRIYCSIQGVPTSWGMKLITVRLSDNFGKVSTKLLPLFIAPRLYYYR